MNLFVIYESAIYNADIAEKNVKENDFKSAMKNLTKCYKQIDDTDLIIETRARVHTERAVKAIQEENSDEAIHELKKLKSKISSKQIELLTQPKQ